jgi:hypothetical protein
MPDIANEGLQEVADRLCELQGVRAVRSNPVTENILICFDPETVSQGSLLALVQVVWHVEGVRAEPPLHHDSLTLEAQRVARWRRLRTVALFFGLGLVTVHRLIGIGEVLTGLRGWGASAAVLIKEFPLLQTALAAYLGDRLADLIPQLVGLCADVLTGNPLGWWPTASTRSSA